MTGYVFSHDDFVALGQQLASDCIAAYQQALAAHATSVGVPAPTANPTIEMLANQYNGQYTVTPAAPQPTTTTLQCSAQLDAIEMAQRVVQRVQALELALGIIPTAGETLPQRIAAIQAKAATAFS